MCVCVRECVWVDVSTYVGVWVCVGVVCGSVRGGVVVRIVPLQGWVVGMHARTHMHTSSVALQIICAAIHTHVVIFTMSPQGHKAHQSPAYVPSLPPPHTHTTKGFREKNTDLMRQDIVDVLKTSKQNLVRALIGLPSVAAAR